jgi:regulator of sigma E protease
LQIEDEILKVNSTRVHTYDELSYEIMNQGYKPMTLTVRRNGEKIVLKDVVVPSYENQGIVFGNMDFLIYRESDFNFGTVMKHTWFRSLSNVKMVYDSLFGLFSGRYGVDAVSGPVGITKVVGQAAEYGFIPVLNLVVIISINLGVMNLLPIPALDGGHIFVYLIEVVRRKPMKRELEGIINLVGLVLMLALAVLIAIKDIIAL